MQFSKNGPEAKAQKREAALLLRFRATAPTPASKKYMSYRAIAEITNCSAYCIQHICRHALKPAIAKKRTIPRGSWPSGTWTSCGATARSSCGRASGSESGARSSIGAIRPRRSP